MRLARALRCCCGLDVLMGLVILAAIVAAAVPAMADSAAARRGALAASMISLANAHSGYNLNVTLAGSGTGSVVDDRGQISCEADCDGYYSEELLVTLTATAAPGSYFAGWSGGGCAGTGDCEVLVTESGEFVTATFELNPPENDDCANATVLNGPGTYMGSNVAATVDGTASCTSFDQSTSKDVWFRYVPVASGMLTIDTTGSGLEDTVLSFYIACQCPPPEGSEVACNDDIDVENGNYWSRVSGYVAAGTPYLIRVSGYEGAAGSFVLNVDGPAGGGTVLDSDNDGTPDICGVPPNDNCCDATVIGPGTYIGSDLLATQDGTPYEDCGNDGLFDIWFLYAPATDGTLMLDTLGSNFDTVLVVYQLAGTCPPEDEVACNDDIGCPPDEPCTPFNYVRQSRLEVEVTAGVCYLIKLVGSEEDDLGLYTLHVSGPALATSPDACRPATCGEEDCNNNGVDDRLDIENGTSLDCNDNWVPDECECFWCNVEPLHAAVPAPMPEVNAQLSHLGGGTPCGEKVADDFYLEPGCMHRITAVRGRLLTNSIAQLRRARVELYEDCNGKPVDQPFFVVDYREPNPAPCQVMDVQPALDGYSVVTYRFDLCDECLWLEGGKTYWVSLIGLPDNVDMTDLSYWVAGNEQLPMLGNIPVKRSGTPGAAWGSCDFGPWESLSDCCIGCVNMDFCVDGYSCPIIWDNGKVDLVNKGGSASGAHQQYHDRTADSFVVKTCADEDICLIEAWIWTNCDPVSGFIELYEDLGCDPRLGNDPFRSYSGDAVKATRSNDTWVVNGRTYRLWRLQVKDPSITLLGGHNYWLSAGAISTGNFNTNSFFAWSKYGCDPCNGVNSYRITPGMHRTLRPPPTEWADVIPARDFAFRISAKGPNAIPQDGEEMPEGPLGTPACIADANNNGDVAVDDIFTFLSAWFSGCP